MSPLLKQQIVGEHVRRLRQGRGLSGRELAAQTGFSPSFISQVETGQASPSISSMERIAHALGVTLGEFFVVAAAGEGGHVLRAEARQTMESGWSTATVEALGPRGQSLEAMLITLAPGGRSGKHPYGHPTEEFAFVLEGEPALTLGPQEHVLGKGDSVTILPGELRLWENRTSRPVRLLVVSAGARARPGRAAVEREPLSDEARRVLRAVALFDEANPTAPLPLKKIAMSAMEEDAKRAGRALQDLDAAGCLRTDTMGWQSGWLTARGRAAAGRGDEDAGE